ncbi:MAG: Trm112 family protein [Desulfuromonadaceae bacterium]
MKINSIISKELLAILACPVCKSDLEPDTDRSALLCRHCLLAFPMRDGIPVMLIDQAERIS